MFFLFLKLHCSISPSNTLGELNEPTMPCIEFKFINSISSATSNTSLGVKYPNVESEASSTLNSLVSTTVPLQTTLVSAACRS